MTGTADDDDQVFKVVCWGCSRGGFWLVPDDYVWTCMRCGSENVKVIPIDREVRAMGFKKHGVGEVIEVERTDMDKTASKVGFTKDDERELAQENQDEQES